MRARAARRQNLTLIGLVVTLFVGFWLSLSVGAIDLDPASLWTALTSSRGDVAEVIVRTLRAPRLLLAAAAGAVLAMGGVALQALFRNPLADPALIGVSAGAAVGAATATVLLPLALGFAGASATALHLHSSVVIGLLAPLSAFIGAVGAAGVLWRVASTDGHPHVARMLLAGVALNALAGALVGLALYAADAQGLRALTAWMLGSLAGSTWTTIAVPVSLCLFACAALSWSAPQLDALLLGDRGARQLGVDPERLLRWVAIWVALGVGASVAVTGIIGFIGLVVPHGLRLWLGPRHRVLMPLAGLGGAALLVLADVAARVLLAPSELPVGVLTSLLGAPFFLLLVAKARPGELA